MALAPFSNPLSPGTSARAGAAAFFRSPVALLLLLWVLELAAHVSLLRLPYYWDEAGYYVPAAYDFFRTGTLIPFSTLTNAHPPGLSLYLALIWKLFGFRPLVTRIGMCLVASVALLGIFSLARRLLRSTAAAVAVTLLTACYPVWFAQSTLAQADLPAAALTLWGLRFALAEETGANLAIALCFIAAALTKEIAIGTPLALAAYELAAAIKAHRTRAPATVLRVAALLAPVAPLALWFAYHRWKTGFLFGNPQYLRYNAAGTLAPARILLALAHRAVHLTAHLNLFVPVAIAVGSLLLPARGDRPRIPPYVVRRIWTVLVANAVLFSVLGGALLTRYLLPMYPLVLLLAVAAVYRRFRVWFWFPALAAAAFAAALLLPPPYRIAPEDTLAYRDAVVLEQQAIGIVEQRYPHSSVLTAWPVSDGLRKPELGYVRVPTRVVAIDNFSLAAIKKLQGEPQDYSTAIVFSTKYTPARLPFAFGPWSEREDRRWFDFHRDLDAAQVAALLGGTVVWQAQRGAEWAAVLRFRHPQLASL